MHAIAVLLSYSLNCKLHSGVQEQSFDIAKVQARQTCTVDVPLHLAVHSAYVRIFMYSVTSTGGRTQTLQMNIFSPKISFLGGLSPSPLLSPSTLSPSQIQLIQHTASTCDNIHTEVSSRKKYKSSPLPKHRFKGSNKKKSGLAEGDSALVKRKKGNVLTKRAG